MRAAVRRFKPFIRLLSTAAPDAGAIVVGAGVVGLAIARQLAASGLSGVLVLEAADRIGTETSSRSSEVIHAGLYYAQNSLKARLCVKGNKMMYDYCAERDVPHSRLGKLIVATSAAQIPALRALQRTAAANGVSDLRWVDASEVSRIEPAVECAAALLSPSSGIVDSHALMERLQAELEARGGAVALRSRVVGGNLCSQNNDGSSDGLHTIEGEDAISGERFTLTTQFLVIAAGLHSQSVAATLQGFPPTAIPPLHLAKGNYFALRRSGGGPPPFSRLIYPLPEPGGLGTHATLDLAGGVRFGPDVEWLSPGINPSEIDYTVNPDRGAKFEAAARAFFHGMAQGALVPAYAGVRPKVAGPGQPAGDFVVYGGVPGVVAMFGIESPGLTASLALAEEVERRLLQGR